MNFMMKRLFVTLALALSALALNASPTDVICGPWISDVSQTSFTVNWVTEGETLSWVEAGVDDGCVFYASKKQKYYQKYQYGQKKKQNIVQKLFHVRSGLMTQIQMLTQALM